MIECHTGPDLVRWISENLEKMGAGTLIGPSHENLCRRARPEEIEQFAGLEWVIESEGLPNLIHEYVHALFLGRIEDDHGFDYGEIPLDLEREEHRRLCWEELSCCALSTTTCAPLHERPDPFARAWFIEQFEIQGVFHGLEDNLDGFRRRIDAQLHQPPRLAELEETVAWAHQTLQEALSAQSACYVLPPCDFSSLWRNYREYAGLDAL